jgi:hypothetical protein
LWFNSAKFFDIEYQVYGNVPPVCPTSLDSLFWQRPQQSVRIVYDRVSKKVQGFQVLGVRYRQEVCEKWIQQGAHVEEVLQNLENARFDPEFSKRHEPEIRQLYTQKTGFTFPKQERFWQILRGFIKSKK